MKDLLVQIPERQTESLWAWVVCTASFFIQFSFGFQNSFGTYFVALLDKYGRSESETAWVGSMAIGLTYLLGPLSTYLCRHFGCRIVACTGSLIVIVSAFLTSMVSDNMMWMYLSFGVLTGLGASMLYFSSLVVLIEYFHKHLSLANGIAVSGSGIGTLVLNLMSQHLISNYGLSVTYKAMAGVYGFCFLAGLTYTPLNGGPKDISQPCKKEVKTEESLTLLSRCRAYLRIGEQWKNKGFIVWTIATGVVLFAYFIPSVYLISIAKGIGVPPSKGILLVGFLAVCQTIGKVGFGRLADYPRVNRLTIFQFGLLVSAVANALLPLAKSFEALVAYCIVQGTCDGCFGLLIGLVTHDIVGKRLMADALGCLYLVVAIPMTLGPPVAGMFYDRLGNYDAVFFLASGLVCTGTCLMFIVPWLVPRTLPEKDLLIFDDDNPGASFNHSDDEHYDMSYVDEQKLADLFGKKKARNLLLDRASLRNSCASTRASSFVLFSIVSDDQHRDISAYTSRQELSITSGANTPLRGTPGTRRRLNDPESRVSMYSLRQSCASVAHSEVHIAQDNADPESLVAPLIHREPALETVEEVNEVERKISREERKSRQEEVERVHRINVLPEETISVGDDASILEDNFNEETFFEDINVRETDLSEDGFALGADEIEEVPKRDAWASDSKNSLKSSGTQLSEGTVDSGYDETSWMGSSDVDTRYSIGNLIDNEKLPAEIIYRSYSCINVSALPPNEFPPLTSTSDDCIDYIEDKSVAFPQCICTNDANELGSHRDSNTNIEHIIEEATPEMAPVLINKETLPDIQKKTDLDFTEDVYSMEAEKALELEEADEHIDEKYDTRSFNFDFQDSFRETVV